MSRGGHLTFLEIQSQSLELPLYFQITESWQPHSPQDMAHDS